jgi:hypothetical protein
MHFVIELLGESAASAAQPPEHNGRGRTELQTMEQPACTCARRQ